MLSVLPEKSYTDSELDLTDVCFEYGRKLAAAGQSLPKSGVVELGVVRFPAAGHGIYAAAMRKGFRSGKAAA